MIEILLNAARLAVSKDAREGVSGLIAALDNAPAWKRSVVTLEAAFTGEEKERLHLLRDVIVQKLQSLDYQPRTCGNFRLVFGELSANAIEHGKPSRWRKARVLVDVSQTYVSLTVFNPKRSKVNLTRWIERAKDHLVATQKRGRGRGLLMTYRKADSLEQVGGQCDQDALLRG